jgi:hypothetical protein
MNWTCSLNRGDKKCIHNSGDKCSQNMAYWKTKKTDLGKRDCMVNGTVSGSYLHKSFGFYSQESHFNNHSSFKHFPGVPE